MIQLIIKGDADDALVAVGNRHIPIENEIIAVMGTHAVIAYTKDENEFNVVRWFCETDARDCRPGFGYQDGALLHYMFR